MKEKICVWRGRERKKEREHVREHNSCGLLGLQGLVSSMEKSAQYPAFHIQLCPLHTFLLSTSFFYN